MVGTGAVQVSLSAAGTVVYTNYQGNSTDTGWTLSNLADKGMPVQTLTGSANDIKVDLGTFQTPGLPVKLRANLGDATINATDATSAQIDAFIANHAGAGAGSLFAASVNASQFVALKDAALVSANGVFSLDATNATQPQIAAMAANAGLIQTLAIENIELQYGQINFTPSTPNLAQIGIDKIALDGASVDASFVLAAGAGAMITNINANIAKIAAVDNVSLAAADLANAYAFNTFAGVVVDRGIDSINAAGMTTAEWTTLIANRAVFNVGSISGVDGTSNLTVANFLTIPNKFAVNGVGANGLSLLGATSAQVDQVVANKAALADLSLTNATITAAQFAALKAELALNAATVNATTATSDQVDSIVAYLGKFANGGLSNLTLSPAQAAVANTNAATFNPAVGATNVTQVVATSAAIINTDAITTKLNITGSDGADNITLGSAAANTVQGGKGADVIKVLGTSTVGQDLRGGNAADTINGGDGNDTITGGKSIAVQYLTGGAGVNTFNNIAASNNMIMDLKGSGATADVVNNAAGAVTIGATTAAGYTISAASVNNGALTLTGVAGTHTTVSAALLTGTVGVTMLAGVDLGSNLIGSNFADTLNGSKVGDSLAGGAGDDIINSGGALVTAVDTLIGGTGNDTFNVQTDGASTPHGYANITDLTTGDTIVVSYGATLTTDALVGGFVATSATTNAGTASITAASTGSNIDMSYAGGTAGWTLLGGASGSNTLVGSAQADTLTGGAVADTLTGGAGNDSITGGLGADFITGGAGADAMVLTEGVSSADKVNYTSLSTIAAQTGITIATADNIAGFTSGTDKLVTGTAGTGSNLVSAGSPAATYAVALSNANAAFAASGVNYYFTVDTDDNTGLLFVDATPGDGSADAVIKLAGVTSIAATDIIAS